MTTEKINTLRSAIVEVQKRIHENESARKKASEDRAAKADEITTLRTQSPADITATTARERRRLVAKIALGDAAESDLAKFDKETAEKQKAIAKQSVPKEMVQALEDITELLDEKIKGLDAEGKALVAERDAAWVRYLGECAERDGAIFNEHGGIAFEAMCRVVNYGSLIHRIKLLTDPNARNNIGLGFRDFCIPTLGTQSTKLPPEKFSSVGVDTNLYTANSDANLEKFTGKTSELPLFEEFEKAGLKCPVPPPSLPTAEVVESGTKKARESEPGEKRSEIWRQEDHPNLPAYAIIEGEE